MTIHLQQKPFPCTHIDQGTGQKCTMAFDTAGRLRAHEFRIHSDKRFVCAECSNNQQQQTSGMDTADDAADQSFTFPTYTLLQEHIRIVHPPRCPNCPIVCSTSRELRRHLEVAHGHVSLGDRQVFACTFPGCDRSFTKRGNLSVHIRTVHEKEKRFCCGESDLSTSKKVAGWNGNGCGKRYGSKLALEEHIRTAHLGFQNAKAERRQRLGLNSKRSQNPRPSHQMSTLAALTGQGYAEETGRHIACLYASCEYRFHRDYDLWNHMTAKHGCSEDEVQGLFLQRALLADQNSPGGNTLGIYGLEFDHAGPSFSHSGNDSFSGISSALTQSNDSITLSGEADIDTDFVMQDDYTADVLQGAGGDRVSSGHGRVFSPGELTPSLQGVNSVISNENETTLIDPVLTYHMMEE